MTETNLHETVEYQVGQVMTQLRTAAFLLECAFNSDGILCPEDENTLFNTITYLDELVRVSEEEM